MIVHVDDKAIIISKIPTFPYSADGQFIARTPKGLMFTNRAINDEFEFAADAIAFYRSLKNAD